MARLRKHLTPLLYMSPTVIMLIILMLVPIALVVWYSLQDNVITNPDPVFVGLANYKMILQDEVFRRSLVNTAIFVVGSVVAHLTLGLAFAMLLNTTLLPKGIVAIFRAIFVLPWLLTGAIVAVLWRLILHPHGIFNYILQNVGLVDAAKEWLSDPQLALLSVTLIQIWRGYPFFMISLLAGLQGISPDLYEAASIDGAGGIRKFWSITIPQLKPIIISMALLDLIWTSHEFTIIWMTTGGGPLARTEMLSTYTYKFAFEQYLFSSSAAAAVLTLLVSAILAYAYVRHQRNAAS